MPGTGTSNIDFLPTDVILLLCNSKITFSQGGVTDLQVKVFGSQTIQFDPYFQLTTASTSSVYIKQKIFEGNVQKQNISLINPATTSF